MLRTFMHFSDLINIIIQLNKLDILAYTNKQYEG